MRRILITGLPITAIVVAVINGAVITMATAHRARAHQTLRDLGDWVILLLPIIAVLTAFVLSLAVLYAGRLRSFIGRCALWGAFTGSFLFLLLQAYTIIPRYGRIIGDGTAFWALASLPVVYVGFPLLLVGSIAGLGTGIVVTARKAASKPENLPKASR